MNESSSASDVKKTVKYNCEHPCILRSSEDATSSDVERLRSREAGEEVVGCLVVLCRDGEVGSTDLTSTHWVDMMDFDCEIRLRAQVSSCYKGTRRTGQGQN